MAEYYHIYNYREYSARYIATLLCGLRQGSRVLSALSGSFLTLEQILLAHIADNTALNFWAKTENARNGNNRPPSMLNLLTNKSEKQSEGFETVEDYEQAKRKILEG